MEAQPRRAPGHPSEGEVQAAVARKIAAVLPTTDASSELAGYYRLLREYPSRPGKGIRARLALLSTAAHGAPWPSGLTAAAALELFQNWVLIHDDIEDDSDERRGLPTLHRQVGRPLAINAGDGLHAYMWELLLTDERLPREVAGEFLWLIHRTSEGQHLDLSWVEEGRLDIGEAEYLEMVRLKTACYTAVSPLRLGSLCAGRRPAEQLTQAGEHLGIAFQIRDDVLNLTPGAPHGKEFAGDLYEGKRTLILAHFFAHARPGDRQEAIERLSGTREQRTREDVDALLRLLNDYGSLSYAQGQAEARAEQGLSLARAAFDACEDRQAADELVSLLEWMAKRSR